MRALKVCPWGILLLAGIALNASNHNTPYATRVASMEYPRLAALAQITGTVLLRVSIDNAGKVLNVRGVSGHPVLSKAAEANLKLWRFSAAPLSGNQVPYEFDFTYVFKLNGGSKESRPCSGLVYEYPGTVTIVSTAPHAMP